MSCGVSRGLFYGYVGEEWGAYEEADDPCFDDGEVRGEDREPGHGGRRGARSSRLGECKEEIGGLLEHGLGQGMVGSFVSNRRWKSWICAT